MGRRISFVFQSAIQKYKGQDSGSVTLPVVSYECEAWFLALREERRKRVFEKRVLRKRHASEKRGGRGVETT
jgi:hypothetical protein